MKSTRGGSLLEIVIAIQCTALLMLFLSRTLPLARRQMRDADQKLGGALVAQNVLEKYMVVPTEEWPQEPIPVTGPGREVVLHLEPWAEDSRVHLARATVQNNGQVEYQLETVVLK